jgi:hypothetical protein
MCSQATVAKAAVTAVCTLTIALLTIGIGVNSTSAGSNQPSGLKFTPISPEGVYRSSAKADKARRFTQARMMGFHEECSAYPDMRFPCEPNLVCEANPGANGRNWCVTATAPDACMHTHEECSWPPVEGSRCCAGDDVCRGNPNANGHNWCVGDVQ